MEGKSLIFAVGLMCLLGSSLATDTYRMLIPPTRNSPSLSIFSVDKDGATAGTLRKTQVELDEQPGVHRPHIAVLSDSPKVQLNSVGATDAYMPMPDSCLGRKYLLSTLRPDFGGQAFAVFGSGSNDTQITVTIPEHLVGTQVWYREAPYSAGDSFDINVDANTMQLVTSDTSALDGIQVTGNKPISVLTGTSGSAAIEGGPQNTLVESMPPLDMLGQQYVVTMMPGAKSASLKIVSMEDATRLLVTVYKSSSSVSMKEVSIDQAGQTWAYAMSDIAITIASNHPILVLQYVAYGFDLPLAMTVVPPLNQWSNRYHLHPLTSGTSSRKHSASIVIDSKQIDGLLGTRLADLQDVTSLLDWDILGTSGLASVHLQLDENSVVELRHFDPSVTFQVILSGRGETHEGGAYALPGAVNQLCGRNDLDTQEEFRADKENSERLRRKRALGLRRIRRSASTTTTTGAPTTTTTTGAPTTTTTTGAPTTTTTGAPTTTAGVTVSVTATGSSTLSTTVANTTAANVTTEDNSVPAGAVAGAAVAGAAVAGGVAVAVAVKVTAVGAATGAGAAAAGTGAAGATAAAATSTAAAGGAAGQGAATGATAAANAVVVAGGNPAAVAPMATGAQMSSAIGGQGTTGLTAVV